MFSVLVYLFCAVIALWASRYFFALWKKNALSSYGEFSIFFFLLATSFIIYITPFIFGLSPVSGIWAQVGNFFTLFAFAFVLRSFVRFQGLSFSPNVITALVTLASATEAFVAFLFPTAPVLADNLIYWHYPPANYIVYSVLIFLFTIIMAITLLSNLKNIQKHQRQILFLGTGFITGGVGGVLLVSCNTFGLLLTSYVLLLLTFVLATLFLITSSNKKE
ncbi:hypothetical protein HY250_01360 [Candidatus Azambacteria bacterium]|nr:hypothetical protein [Candidatus Azambacteria bacterium]